MLSGNSGLVMDIFHVFQADLLGVIAENVEKNLENCVKISAKSSEICSFPGVRPES